MLIIWLLPIEISTSKEEIMSYIFELQLVFSGCYLRYTFQNSVGELSTTPLVEVYSTDWKDKHISAWTEVMPVKTTDSTPG